MQSGSRCLWNSRHSDSPDAAPIFLRGNDDQHLHLCRLLSGIVFCCADLRLVHLNAPFQTLPPRTHHGPTQLVQPRPGRQVASQPENLLNRYRTGPSLLAGNLPDSAKPQPQGLVGVLEDCTGGDRSLAPAKAAHQPPPRRGPSLLRSAAWADKTVGPTQPHQILAACVFVRKPLFEFQDGTRVVFHTPAYYRLCSVESIE